MAQAQKGKPTPTPNPTAAPTPLPTATPVPVPVASPPTTVETITTPREVALTPYRDPWTSNKQRWWDASDDTEKRYDAFLAAAGETPQTFNYANANVTLTYDAAPSSPFFVGKINATGLKPNFCYQLKLVGKPTKGTRGWGEKGDDEANKNLGLNGRWWCDSYHGTATNFTDSHFYNTYLNVASGHHDMYGYLYTGMFVTDAHGNATDFYFTGEYNFHVTWKSTQGGGKHHYAGAGPIFGGLLDDGVNYYGYGLTAPDKTSDGSDVWLELWYEYEYIWANSSYGTSSRPRYNDGKAHLPAGNYNCRFVITEESFHSSGEGGYWATVLGSEDYTYNTDGTVTPDQNPDNDIAFTIPSTTAPSALTAAPGFSQVTLTWSAPAAATAETTYTVKRSSATGGDYTTLRAGLTGTTYVDTAVANETRYYYVVTASDNGVQGTRSNEAIAIPLTPPPSALPAAPSALSASSVSRNRVDLAWQDNSENEDGFEVERSTNGGTWTLVASTEANISAYSDLSVAANKTYSYRVRAFNTAGKSGYSNTLSVKTPR